MFDIQPLSRIIIEDVGWKMLSTPTSQYDCFRCVPLRTDTPQRFVHAPMSPAKTPLTIGGFK